MKEAARNVSMELMQVRVRDFSNSGFTAVVYMQVSNANGFDVTIFDFDYHALAERRNLPVDQYDTFTLKDVLACDLGHHWEKS